MIETSSSAYLASDPGMLPSWWRMVDRRDGVHLLVGGELDMSSADLLDEALRLLEIFPLTSHVDLSAVTYADSDGMEPLAASARRRARNELPPLHLAGASRPVKRLFDVLSGAEPRESATAG
ncbi:STAS domain-containing protein [Pseudonocardia xinjiangensis]|uniref:STAS domain-containing protein n=1 Tax=Pseudonocardia xinjiangensis TaxID=75289 RepID=A0ABX1RI77_9PSEU|nr:STAS domain-containing protein [Pseudonocardia xinjiangensis]NMH78938.1 STAS domain-containing protein [Pseudonocardia xinjiangensis]